VIETEEIGIIISLLSGTIVPVGFYLLNRHYKGVDATSDKALLNSENLVGIEKTVNGLKETILSHKDHIGQRIDDTIHSMNENDESIKTHIAKLYEKLQDIVVEIRLHEQRIQSLEGNRTK
jgi:hypothetical protein